MKFKSVSILQNSWLGNFLSERKVSENTFIFALEHFSIKHSLESSASSTIGNWTVITADMTTDILPCFHFGYAEKHLVWHIEILSK